MWGTRLKTGDENSGLSHSWRLRFNSIALRMALWYAVSAFGLIVAATGILYWALTVNLAREDAQTLESQLQNLRLVLRASSPSTPLAVPSGTGLSFQIHQQILVRLLDGEGQTLFETPGMASLAPAALFPRPEELRNAQPIHRNVGTAGGRHFQTITARAGAEGSEDRRVFQLAVDREDEERFLRKYRDLMMVATR